MSDQNSTTPDPNDAVPGYEPPSTSEPAAAAEPPAYTPPAAPEPPAYTPPAASEPPSYSAAEPPSYSAPSAPEPPSYSAPATGGYEPPAGGYSQPAAGGYTPPPAQPGFPEPPGPGAYPPPPPAAPYAGGFTDPGAYPAAGGYPGTPVPSVGGAALADWPKRALGGLIDYVAAGIVISVVGSLLSNVNSTLGTLVNIVLSIGWMCYLGYKSGTTGITFGRSINKTKLVSAETGQPIGVTNGIIRQLAHIVDSIICYIGWLFPLWDAQKQTLADKIMKTVVVDNSADPNASTYNWG
ncbi:MAG: RDD family protein [Actinobacteria bacterium]|nr:RDD family protein [Actinomycetota bacterium]